MKTIPMTEVDLPRLLDEVANGETFVITKDDVPVGRLVPPIASEDSDKDRARRLVEEWREFRRKHNITLGDDLTIRDLIEEGRKY